jgi:Na+/H+-dicarboxylate symporter
MFRKMPFILLAVIVIVGISCPWLTPTYQSILYGISLSLKSLIVFVLPFIIFGLLFKTSVQLSKQASKWILFIIIIICLSNFISTLLSYAVGSFAYQLDLSMDPPSDSDSLIPWGDVSLPKLVDNSLAMFAGLLLGIVFGCLRPVLAHQVASSFEKIIGVVLKSFLYVIPLFVAGFIVKMMHDGVMGYILRSYSLIFVLVAGTVFTYIGLIYFIANGFHYQAVIRSIQNMIPAAIAGFGSMSSAAAMPLTIIGTEKNSKNPGIAGSIIPATVNVHLIGDCFAIPVFAFAIMKSFGAPEPAFLGYLIFAAYFVMAKFSVAAVPGGGILVMLPILETYLGFSAEMLSLITALYILFDPIITTANVLGNGGFAMGIGNLIKHKGQLAQEPLKFLKNRDAT